MGMIKYMGMTLCAGVLAVTAGCGAKEEREALGPAPATAAAPAPAADPDFSARVTRVAYKAGIDRDKVRLVLDLYRRDADPADSGRTVHGIAVLAAARAGLTANEAASVILDYKSLFEGAPAPEADVAQAGP